MSNKENFIHLLIRSVNFFLTIYLMIVATDYSERAGMNFGVINSILTVSVVIQCFVFWVFFREKLNSKIIASILIIMLGVTLILVGRPSEK